MIALRYGTWMRLGMLLVVVLGAWPGLGAAQTRDATAATQPVTQPAAGPTWLRVIGDQINVRSRPDTNSLPVARVDADTVLRAVGRDPYGWYTILPPKDVFSFVSAEFVDRRGPTEGIVSVRSGTLRVRVGSLVQDVDPLQTEVQALLERGTVVRIVGEQGEWLKIEPPAEVRLYVSGMHVEPISDELAGKLRAEPSPAVVARGRAEAASRPVAATRPAEGPDLRGPWGQRLVLVETAISAEGSKPLAEQKWDDALARLKPIAEQRTEPMVARLAQAWIGQLDRRRSDQAAVRDAEEVLRRTARDRAQHEREMELIARARQATSQPGFAARGELLRSYALEARDGRRWYRLQDPLTLKVEAYLEMDPRVNVDPEPYLNQYVGVYGARRTDTSLGADVVRIEAIVVLQREGPATQPTTRPARQGP